jgi:hypothetical protein
MIILRNVLFLEVQEELLNLIILYSNDYCDKFSLLVVNNVKESVIILELGNWFFEDSLDSVAWMKNIKSFYPLSSRES